MEQALLDYYYLQIQPKSLVPHKIPLGTGTQKFQPHTQYITQVLKFMLDLL